MYFQFALLWEKKSLFFFFLKKSCFILYIIPAAQHGIPQRKAGGRTNPDIGKEWAATSASADPSPGAASRDRAFTKLF